MEALADLCTNKQYPTLVMDTSPVKGRVAKNEVMRGLLILVQK